MVQPAGTDSDLSIAQMGTDTTSCPGAELYVRRALGLKLRDATGGFRAFRRDALERMNCDGLESRGYCFQVDLARRAADAGMSAVEVPIVFRERERESRRGRSSDDGDKCGRPSPTGCTRPE